MQIKTIRLLLAIKPIKLVIDGSRKIKPPGLDDLSLYVVAKFFIAGIQNGFITTRAAALAYNFFLAVFPSIIFLFTLIPYIPIDDFQESLFEIIQTMLPKSAFETIQVTIYDIINKPHGGLLSFGFISALIFSTNGFNSMLEAFNETYHAIQTKSAIEQRLTAFVMMIVSVVLMMLAILLIIFSEIIFSQYIQIDYLSYFVLHLGKYIVLIMLCLCFISFNYYFGPKEREGFRFISPGSIMATFFIILASLLFAYYVNNFASYNKLYGSIGTLIVVMLWVYIVSLILLIGFDLNVSIKKAKEKKGRLFAIQRH
jgi:membrane protein